MLWTLGLCLLIGSDPADPAPAPGVRLERIFGPELPGKYKHPACITELTNGDFLIVYYGGAGEYATDTAVWGSRLKKGETKWSTPKPIADTPFRADGNAVIWQASDGMVWLFYVVRYGETWSYSRIHAKFSRDDGQTWSDSLLVTTELGTMVRSRPIELANGEILLPIYHETGNDPECVGADTTAFFLRFDPKRMTFIETNRVHARKGALQPAVAAVAPEHLVCYCRRGGGYGPTTDGFMVRAESRDGGKTWGEGKDAPFPNPNAAVDFIRLKNGHLLLVYNDSMTERTPLTVSLSTDGDKTYPFKKDIIAGPGDFGYPTAIQAADGKIHVVFTSNERSIVNRAVFDESIVTNAGAK